MRKDNSNNYNLKRLLIYIVVITLAVILTVGSYYTFTKVFTKEESNVQDAPIEEKQPQEIPEEEPYVNVLPDYRAQYNNANIMGIIEIPGLNINTPVARSVNNKYYLEYNLYNEYDQIGAPFFDYRNLDLGNDKQINVYGHNTQNSKIVDKLPFVKLESFTDKSVFDTYKYIYLSLDDKKIKYEVEGIKILTDGNNEHMKLIFYSDDDFLTHVNKMFSNSLYIRDNFNITAQDKLIVLQICYYNPVGSYLLVFGKAVN